METVLDVLHVVGAVFLVGPMAILPMTAMRELRTGNATRVAGLARSTSVFSLASLVVAILGFGVLGTSDPKYDLSVTTPWVLASLVCYLLALAVSLGVVVPSLRRVSEPAPASIGAAAGAGGGVPHAEPTGGGTAGDYGRIAMSSGIMSLLLLAVVVLMVWKP